MAVDCYLNFDTKVDTSGFDKGTDQIGDGLDKLKSQLKGLAKTIAVVFSAKQII